MERKIVHVIGTGTIGEPLIGLLCDYRDQLGIDEVSFHKNSAHRSERTKVINLLVLYFIKFSSFLSEEYLKLNLSIFFLNNHLKIL